MNVAERVAGQAQEFVDELLAFVGGGLRVKGGGLFDGWQRAGGVEESSADESGIVAKWRWFDAQFSEFLCGQFVDEVVVSPASELDRIVIRYDEHRDAGLAFEADHDRCLSFAVCSDEACLGDVEHGFVHRVEE